MQLYWTNPKTGKVEPPRPSLRDSEAAVALLMILFILNPLVWLHVWLKGDLR